MIYIFTQRDPFFTDEFLREFDLFGIEYTIIDMPNFRKGKYTGVKKAVQLYGIFGFTKLLNKFLFKYRKSKLFNNVKQLFGDAKTVNEIFENLDLNDIVLSLSAPERLPVEKCKKGILKINFHCGRLPRYAGMMPIFWQMYYNEENVTITCHDLADEIDTGRVISEHVIPIEGTLFEVSQTAKRQSAHIFRELILRGELPNISMKTSDEKVILSKFPKKSDVMRFKAKHKLI